MFKFNNHRISHHFIKHFHLIKIQNRIAIRMIRKNNILNQIF